MRTTRLWLLVGLLAIFLLNGAQYFLPFWADISQTGAMPNSYYTLAEISTNFSWIFIPMLGLFLPTIFVLTLYRSRAPIAPRACHILTMEGIIALIGLILFVTMLKQAPNFDGFTSGPTLLGYSILLTLGLTALWGLLLGITGARTKVWWNAPLERTAIKRR